MPTKVTRERFEETNPDEHFDHFLCLKLGWRSVAEMRRGMSNAEWNRWRVLFGIQEQARELAAERAKG